MNGKEKPLDFTLVKRKQAPATRIKLSVAESYLIRQLIADHFGPEADRKDCTEVELSVVNEHGYGYFVRLDLTPAPPPPPESATEPVDLADVEAYPSHSPIAGPNETPVHSGAWWDRYEHAAMLSEGVLANAPESSPLAAKFRDLFPPAPGRDLNVNPPDYIAMGSAILAFYSLPRRARMTLMNGWAQLGDWGARDFNDWVDAMRDEYTRAPYLILSAREDEPPSADVDFVMHQSSADVQLLIAPGTTQEASLRAVEDFHQRVALDWHELIVDPHGTARRSQQRAVELLTPGKEGVK